VDAQSPITHSSWSVCAGGVFIFYKLICIHISTSAGSWPSTLRLPGLTNHIRLQLIQNLAHQPIEHIYNSLHITCSVTGLGLGDTTIPSPYFCTVLSAALHNICTPFKIFKKMWVLYPHNLFMLPCRVLKTVPGPLDLYKLHSLISELFSFPVHLQDTFWFHLNRIPIDYMISIRYIDFLSNEI
jgi:hypothetical protein